MNYNILVAEDSHGHILEYGATKQLPLEGTKTIQGVCVVIIIFAMF